MPNKQSDTAHRQGQSGQGGKSPSGAPKTKDGHTDRRTKAGQEEEKRETGHSRHEEGARKGGQHSHGGR